MAAKKPKKQNLPKKPSKDGEARQAQADSSARERQRILAIRKDRRGTDPADDMYDPDKIRIAPMPGDMVGVTGGFAGRNPKAASYLGLRPSSLRADGESDQNQSDWKAKQVLRKKQAQKARSYANTQKPSKSASMPRKGSTPMRGADAYGSPRKPSRKGSTPMRGADAYGSPRKPSRTR